MYALEFIKDKRFQLIAVGLGAAVAVMTVIYYHHQIKLSKAKLKEIEEGNPNGE